MDILSVVLALCEGKPSLNPSQRINMLSLSGTICWTNSRVTGHFWRHDGHVTASYDAIFFIIYTGDRPAKRIWIGLYRNTQWVWKFSGEIATFVDWDSGQPNENTDEIYGVYLVDTQKVHDFTDRERAYMCEIWIK